MAKQTRRKFSADFKAKVALEAIKNQKTLAQLSQQFEVNPITISKWKAEFLENMAVIFERESSKAEDSTESMDRLFAQIGQMKVELDFLKKSARKLGIPESEWRP
jgi:transposase-like protein